LPLVRVFFRNLLVLSPVSSDDEPDFSDNDGILLGIPIPAEAKVDLNEAISDFVNLGVVFSSESSVATLSGVEGASGLGALDGGTVIFTSSVAGGTTGRVEGGGEAES